MKSCFIWTGLCAFGCHVLHVTVFIIALDLVFMVLLYMQETLRVKDEELHNLAREIRARDSTIKEIAEKLSETAEAAEEAASAAHTMDEHRKIACVEIERLKKESEVQLQMSKQKVCYYDGPLDFSVS